MSKKLLIVLSVAMFLLTSAISYFFFSSMSRGLRPGLKIVGGGNVVSTDTGDTVDTGPKTEECPTNGQLFSKTQRSKWESRRPIGVAIENHLDARPQSGLSKADVIYEAVAEGGITRFLAIYYCQDTKLMGPVRSARIYFVKLLQGYGLYPLYAHVGGANTPGPADALGEVRDLGWDGFNDLNQFAVPFPYYYRDYERLPNRATEHTMYSSTSKLWTFAQKERELTDKDKNGKLWNAAWKPWKFQDDAKQGERGTTAKISFGFWSKFDADNYAVSWAYDAASNNYVRSNGGARHVDKNTGKPIVSKNIVVVFADESSANDGYEGGHLLYDVVGQGKGLLFKNGRAESISWRKNKETDMLRFYDTSGKEVELVRGQVFVEILPTGNDVAY